MSRTIPIRATARILVAESDEVTRIMLAENLSADRFTAIAPDVLQDRFEQAADCDLAIVDQAYAEELPELLSKHPDLAVIVVGSGGEGDVARAIAAGAVDYLAEPFAYPELLLRIRVQLEHREIAVRARGIREFDGLHLDTRLRRVHVDGRLVRLAAKEYELLRALMVDPQRVWTKQELLRSVWGYESSDRTRTLDSHASRLRRKLDPEGCRFIANCWGVGYRLGAS